MKPHPNPPPITRARLLAAVFCLLSIGTVHGQPLNFTFSFVGDANHSTVNGTVSGELIGLQNNASSAPTDIIITSAPAGLDVPSLSYDLNANGWNLSGVGNTITVDNGVISGADYQASLSGGNFFDLDYTASNGQITVTGLNGFELGGERYIFNSGGVNGVTYLAAAAPEPSSWALALVALICFALSLRARYRYRISAASLRQNG